MSRTSKIIMWVLAAVLLLIVLPIVGAAFSTMGGSGGPGSHGAGSVGQIALTR